MDIYFDTDGNAYSWMIPNSICKISSEIWNIYRWGERGVDWKIENGTFMQSTSYDDMYGKLNPEKKWQSLLWNLSDTDYLATKFAEGELSESEFAPIREQRKQWRAEINRLESMSGMRN